MHNSPKPTREQFDAYQAMFAYFNRELFGGSLPQVVLNFSRHARSLGFFAPQRWERRGAADERSHEISLNPDTLTARDPRDVASTLVHEMVHLWQEVAGTPARRGYHNREWAEKMERVGLMPSNTGTPGGQRVGQRMTHYIIEGGAFALAFAKMPERALLPWQSGASSLVKPKMDPSKAKYTCPGCACNVWGKAGLSLICGACVRPYAQV